ncbi:MAG: Wadjet anti-phage system protein JetD domain-containing protein, partial [Alkalispirochaeta sp.]
PPAPPPGPPAVPDGPPALPLESPGFPIRFGFRDRPVLVRFRVLDPDLAIAGFRDLTVPADELAAARPEGIDRVFVVENDVTALAFPEVSRSIVVFGRGFRVGEVAVVSWLNAVDVVYTGDLDTHGFAILNRLRTHLPHVRSILMDSDTLLSHRVQWSHEKSQTTADLPLLNRSEQAVYDALRYNRYGKGVRLEQERISFGRILEAVRSG